MSGFPSPSFADPRDEFRADGGCPTSLNQRQPCSPSLDTMISRSGSPPRDAAYWEDSGDLGNPPRLGEASAGTRLVEAGCTNDIGGPLLSDGRRRTTKPPFVDSAEAALSGCIGIIDWRAACSAGHAPKQPLGVAQVPGRCPTSEATRGRYRRDRSPQSWRREEQRRYRWGGRDVNEGPICANF